MVDSWNWLLDVLIPPLIDAALDSIKRKQREQQRAVNRCPQSRISNCNDSDRSSQKKTNKVACQAINEGHEITHSCSHFWSSSSTNESKQADLLQSLIPPSYAHRMSQQTYRGAKPTIHRRKRTKSNSDLPFIEIRPNLTAKKITVNENPEMDYAVEIETVPTHRLFDCRKHLSRQGCPAVSHDTVMGSDDDAAEKNPIMSGTSLEKTEENVDHCNEEQNYHDRE